MYPDFTPPPSTLQSTLAITDLAIPNPLLYRMLCSSEGGLPPNPPCYTGRAPNSVPDEVCEISPVCNPCFPNKWYLLYWIPMQGMNTIQQTNFNHPLPPIKSYSTNSTVSTRFLPSKSTLQNPLSPPTFSHKICLLIFAIPDPCYTGRKPPDFRHPL